MAKFRLLHASDLHIGRYPHRYGIPEILTARKTKSALSGNPAAVATHSKVVADAFAAFVHVNSPGLDMVIVSGDLAATGSGNDLRTAHDYVDSFPTHGFLNRRGRPTLRNANLPLVLIPGNHDRYRAFHFPGSRAFDRRFGAFWSKGQSAEHLATLHRDNRRIVFLGIDFTLRSGDWGAFPIGFLGQGRVYQKRLDELIRLTREARKPHPDAMVIWVAHFEPRASDAELELLDEGPFVDALDEENIPLLLCGHTHLIGGLKTIRSARICVCGTTTQHASSTGNRFHILDIEWTGNAPDIRLQPYQYDPSWGEFR